MGTLLRLMGKIWNITAGIDLGNLLRQILNFKTEEMKTREEKVTYL